MAERVRTLPPPETGQPDLLIVAGEHSGDEHAARVVGELLALNPELKIAAIGGENLQKAGAQLLFDLTEHSVVGFAEVLKNYGFFKSLFSSIVGWIENHRPRHILFVDYPGFNLRLANRLKAERLSRRGGGEIGLWYYISPQVWAWKARRRFLMADLLDGLAVIFPFEVETFGDTALQTEFVGHPFLAPTFEATLHYDPEAGLLLLPGSRSQPVQRIFPAMIEAAVPLMLERGLKAVVPFPNSRIRQQLKALVETHGDATNLIDFVPAGTPVKARATLTSSGTMSLAAALAGIPGAIAYRAHPITYQMARRLISVPYLGMANLLLQKPFYPEFIQREASPDRLRAELQACLDDPARAERTAALTTELREKLSVPASRNAAHWLAEKLA